MTVFISDIKTEGEDENREKEIIIYWNIWKKNNSSLQEGREDTN